MINDLSQDWNGITWVNVFLFICDYDANNNMINQMWQVWNGSAWVNLQQFLYIYDADNFLISETYKHWNNAGTAIMGGYSTNYYFHTVVGINNLMMRLESITVYPNPASANITIESTIKGSLCILNSSGQVILQQELAEPTITIDVSSLPGGIYLIRVMGEKKVLVGKIIKE